MHNSFREAEHTRNRLHKEIQQLQHANNLNDPEEDYEGFVHLHPRRLAANIGLPMYDHTSPLSRQLQEYLWPPNYKPRIPLFDCQSIPRKFLASYETVVISVGGDALALVKSFVMVVKGVAYDRYNSLKPLSIQSWNQIKTELLATFQGHQPETKTTRDLMNFIRQDDEPLAEY